MILEMAPEKWQMGFKMQHNDHYKMGLYFDLELLCTFYWDGSKDPREWGFSSQPEPHLVFGYEAFMNLKSHISRMVQKSPSLKHVTAAACSSWWSSGCHVAKSQESKFKLMLDWQSISKFYFSFCWLKKLFLHQKLCTIYTFLPKINKMALVTESQPKVPKTLVL